MEKPLLLAIRHENTSELCQDNASPLYFPLYFLEIK